MKEREEEGEDVIDSRVDEAALDVDEAEGARDWVVDDATLVEARVLVVEERVFVEDDLKVAAWVLLSTLDEEDRKEVSGGGVDTGLLDRLDDDDDCLVESVELLGMDVSEGMRVGFTVPVSSTLARHASAAIAPT